MVIPLGEEADVLTVDGAHAELQVGSLKLRQPIDVLRRLGRAKAETQQRPAVSRTSSPGYVPMEIDIRGQRVGEIGDELERYLVEAYQSGLPMVRIIHGKGTGALRAVVRDFLHASPVVARAETAPPNEGGDGATVAYFKET
jgi:DNA mismatch repair protein MutS2